MTAISADWRTVSRSSRRSSRLALESLENRLVPTGLTATDQSYSLHIGATTWVDLIGTDDDGDTISLVSTSSPAHGLFSPAGFGGYYQAPNDFVGTDDFTFVVSDGTSDATGTISITVTDAAPVATNASFTVSHGSGQIFNFLDYLSDADGDIVTPAITQNPAHGTVAGYLWVYTANANYYGPDIIKFKGNDGALDSNIGTISFTVTDAPPTVSVAAQTNLEADVVSVQASASDPDTTDNLTFSATGLPGGATIDSAGLISGTLSYSDSSHGTVSVYHPTVTVTDDAGKSATSAFSWSVTDVLQLASLGPWTGNEGDGTTLAYSVTGESTGVTYSGTNLPPGLGINSSSGAITGVVNYSPVAVSPGTTATYDAVITASEGVVHASTTLAMTVSDTNRFGTLGDAFNSEGDSVSADYSVIDNTGTDTLTYSSSPLPTGLTLDSASGIIDGTISYSAATLGAVSVYPITLTLTDNHSATDYASFSWSVTDQPLVTAPASWSGNEAAFPVFALATLGGTATVSYSSSNLPPGLTVNASTGLLAGTIDYTPVNPSPGTTHTYNAVVTGTYAGVSDTATIAFTVSDVNRLPSPPDQYKNEEDTVSLSMAATDLDGDTLTYSGSNLPPGLTLDTGSGLIHGTINATAASGGVPSTYPSTITLTDNRGATDKRSITWTVNDEPLVGSLNSWYGNEGQSVSESLAAPGLTTSVTYSATSLPAGLTIDTSTGLINGVINYSPVSVSPGTSVTYNAQVLGTDGTTTESTSISWVVVDVNRLPSPGIQSVNEGDVYSLPMTANDTIGTDSLTYSSSTLPAGLSLHSDTGLISGTLAYSLGNTTCLVTVTLTDNHGATDYACVSFSITDVPLVSVPSTWVNSEGDNVTLLTSNTNSSVSYSAVSLPPGLSIDSATGDIDGVINYTPVSLSPGSTHTYDTVVKGSVGSTTDSATIAWTVSDTNRFSLQDQYNLEGDTVSISAAGTDNTSTDTLTYSATTLPLGLTINASTGLITGAIPFNAATPGGVSDYAATLTLTDGSATDTETLDWTVQDQPLVTASDPTSDNEGDTVSWSAAATTETVSYGATSLPPGVTLNAATGAVTGVINYTPVSLSPGTTHVYSVTLTGALAGLTDSLTFAWSVSDTNRLPAIGTQYNFEADTVSLSVQGTDHTSTDTLTYSATSLPAGLTINSSTGLIAGTISYSAASGGSPSNYFPTVTATDNQGAVDKMSLTMVVNDSPLIGGSNTAVSDEGESISLSFATTGSVTYSATSLPPGLALNTTTGNVTGVINYTPVNPSPGTTQTYNAVITGAHGGTTDSTTVAWTVSDTNRLPALGDEINNEGDTVSLSAAGTDNTSSDTLTYSATALPTGLTINSSSGLVTGSIAYNAVTAGTVSVYSATVTVTDNQSAVDKRTFNWTITDLPLLTSLGPQSNNEGDNISLASANTTSSVTYSETSLPAGLTLNTSNGQVTGIIDYKPDNPSPATATAASVTVTAVAGSETESVIFAWTVSDTNRLPSLNTVYNSEGDSVSVSMAATDNTATDTLTYSATGLPTDVSINPTSGLIYGWVRYDDVPTSPFATFTPVVTVSDNVGAKDVRSFIWNITSVDPLQVSDEVNQVGDTVSLSFTPKSTPGASLTYTATDLPDGLSQNSSTGLIAGTIASTCSATYTCTETLVEGTATFTQVFDYLITRPGCVVTMLINDTLDHGDDIALVNTEMPISISLSYPVPGTHTVSLSLKSGSGTFDSSALTLTNGSGAEIQFTATAASTNVDDVVINVSVDGAAAPDPGQVPLPGAPEVAGPQAMTAVKFRIDKAVDATTTPKQMTAYRIPPLAGAYINTDATEITATYTGPSLAGLNVSFAILGASAANGSAIFADTGASTYQIKDPTIYTLRVAGQAQTDYPGGGAALGLNAGKLFIGVVAGPANKLVGGGLLGQTETFGFSVAAIPIGVKQAFTMPENNKSQVGMETTIELVSDSHNIYDLSEVQVIEECKPINGTNALASLEALKEWGQDL